VIKIFATSPEPAYDDALLLEQHQAPITATFTPAFSSDSTPEILASQAVVHACALFFGCGVVKHVVLSKNLEDSYMPREATAHISKYDSWCFGEILVPCVPSKSDTAESQVNRTFHSILESGQDHSMSRLATCR